MRKPSFFSALVLSLSVGACELAADDDSGIDDTDDSSDSDNTAPVSERDEADGLIGDVGSGDGPTHELVNGCRRVSSAGSTNIFASLGGSFEDFEATFARDGATCTTGPLSEATDSKCADPGDVVAGLVVRDSSNEISIYGRNWIEGPDGMSVGAADVGRSVTLDITNGASFVGFQMHSDNPGFARVRYYDHADRVIGEMDKRFGGSIGASSYSTHAGIVCDGVIARVEVEPQSYDLQVVVDDIVFK